MSKKPSRILNDDNLIFGLDRFDIFGIGLCYFCVQIVLKFFGIQFLTIFAVAASILALISIRLRFRRKIIRDSLSYLLVKLTRGGVYQDPKFD